MSRDAQTRALIELATTTDNLLFLMQKAISTFQEGEPYPGTGALKMLRTLMEDLFPDDANFAGFCGQYFPNVHQNFGSGQQFNAKLTMLMDYCRRYEALEKLLETLIREYSPFDQ